MADTRGMHINRHTRTHGGWKDARTHPAIDGKHKHLVALLRNDGQLGRRQVWC